MCVNQNYMQEKRVLLCIWTLAGRVVTAMGANADPDENKSSVHVFFREVAYCTCMCMRADALILREGGLVYQKVLEQTHPISIRVKTAAYKVSVWFLEIGCDHVLYMDASSGQRFEVFYWTSKAHLTHTAGNMYIAFRIICCNLFLPESWRCLLGDQAETYPQFFYSFLWDQW